MLLDNIQGAFPGRLAILKEIKSIYSQDYPKCVYRLAARGDRGHSQSKLLTDEEY
jgi:hypothetical protein